MTQGPGAFICAPAGPVLSKDEIRFFRDAAPWGFILFARNVETPGQVRNLTSALREAVGREAPILIDQEGGRVQRLRGPIWREWEPPLVQVDRDGTERCMYLRGLLIGQELREIGIDANCAPSADIAFPETHAFLQNRCYGRDAETVTRMARETANGLLDAGVLPVIKHAPGHGRAVLDSHERLPVIDVPLADLDTTDFAPFRALADLPMAMTAHIVVPAIDPDRPVTLSQAGMRYLRERIGLDMLIMTDDISMGALNGSVGDRTERAVRAGCDVALHCNGVLSEMEAVAASAGRLTGVSLTRAAAALAGRRAPVEIDIPGALSELGTLVRETAYA